MEAEKKPCWTPALKATLDAIKARMAEEGVAPLLSDLGQDLGISKVAVHKRLRKLQALGLVDWRPSYARSLRLSTRKTAELLEF